MDEKAFDLTGLLEKLPPQLQGILVLGIGIGLAVITWKKFFKQFLGRGPVSSAFAVGDPTVFADMAPLKDLVKNVETLTLQMMKSAVATDGLVASMGELILITRAHFEELRDDRLDLKKERAERDVEKELQRLVADEIKALKEELRKRPPRRRTPRRKPTPTI